MRKIALALIVAGAIGVVVGVVWLMILIGLSLSDFLTRA